MSATNKTANYDLPQFIGSDKPAWLTDFNGAMSAIDTGMATAQATADGADTKADTNASNITTLSGSVNTLDGAVTTLTGTVTSQGGTINTITSLIGNGEPTTQDKTIIGAINEIQAEVEAITPGGSIEASNVDYDNTTSGLTADDVQDAIDEVVSDVATVDAKIGFPTRLSGTTPQYSADGGSTWVNFKGALSVEEVESAENTSALSLTYTFLNNHDEILIECNGSQGNIESFGNPTITASMSTLTPILFHDTTGGVAISGGGYYKTNRKTYHAENVTAGETITFTLTLGSAGSYVSSHVMDYVIFAIN